MSENWVYCSECGEVCDRIGLDEMPLKYAYCKEGNGCNKLKEK